MSAAARARLAPDRVADVSAGHLAEMIESVCYRVVTDQGELWKIAVRVWAPSGKLGRLEPVIHDWVSAPTLDQCFEKLAPRAPETLFS